MAHCIMQQFFLSNQFQELVKHCNRTHVYERNTAVPPKITPWQVFQGLLSQDNQTQMKLKPQEINIFF